MLKNILSNKMFWYVVIGLILLWLVYKNWYKIKAFLGQRDITFQPGESPTITDARQQELKNLTKQLYSDIYDTPLSGHNKDIYDAVLLVTDNELLFMSKFYINTLTLGNSIYDDMGNELYSSLTEYNSPVDQVAKIKARLKKIGE